MKKNGGTKANEQKAQQINKNKDKRPKTNPESASEQRLMRKRCREFQ